MLNSLRFCRRLTTKAKPNEFFKVYEVGPRDGLQNEKTFIATAQKVELVNRLSACGLKTIEAASFVSPKWIPQLKDGEEVMSRIDRFPGTSYPVLVLNAAGLRHATKNNNVEEIAVFSSCSEGFSKINANCTIEENLKRTKEFVAEALKKGLKVRGYLSVVIGCPYDGKTDPKQVAKGAEALLEMGCYEVSLGDTLGIGSVASVTRMLDEVLKVEGPDKLSVHFHDTYGQALANVLVAIDRGIRTADSSVGGLGGCPFAKGASGNVASEDLVYMLHDLGFNTGVNLDRLAETGEWICSVMNRSNASKCSRALMAKKGRFLQGRNASIDQSEWRPSGTRPIPFAEFFEKMITRLTLRCLNTTALILLYAVYSSHAVPVRITSNGIDSVVLAGENGAQTEVVIDTNSQFQERLDSPIEKIEIRLIDENSTSPIVIDISKDRPSEVTPEPGSALPTVSAESSADSHSAIVHEEQAEEPVRLDEQSRKLALTREEPTDDLNLEEELDDTEPENTVEECLANQDKLSRIVVDRLKRDKRKLSKMIRKLNRQQEQYCRPDIQTEEVQHRSCPTWRQEKMVHYYKLMRISYCSDYSRWPNAPKIKRTFGNLFPLYEKLYAFIQKE
ncbi:hypothetical protein QR680_004740 [Steinernema hermaphroditum]|uniref:hydroxymethylglutaryl-CoA lyase n=1 Tax=Steinernema hermaphroditum TaxID=289476 RepID=A0AA39HPN5_9BILA|nr:hypothetical protein QR680_004740 [Steinernema hermaphroditum]